MFVNVNMLSFDGQVVSCLEWDIEKKFAQELNLF